MAVTRRRAQGRVARDAAEARGVRERIDGFTAEKEATFLAELERSGCVTDAARTVGISKTSINRHRRFRPAFDAACKLARTKARGPLEAIAYLRAVEGTETKVIRGGKVVEVRVKPSDAMLRSLMAAADPDKYGNRPKATAEQLEAIRRDMEVEKKEVDEARRMEVVERLVRKMHLLRKRRIRAEGFGMTVDGDLVPPGYGPVAPGAVAMMEDPLAWTAGQDWADFRARAEADAKDREARLA
jgi:hypothetical protein